jgi:hypothetical protein
VWLRLSFIYNSISFLIRRVLYNVLIYIRGCAAAERERLSSQHKSSGNGNRRALKEEQSVDTVTKNPDNYSVAASMATGSRKKKKFRRAEKKRSVQTLNKFNNNQVLYTKIDFYEFK